MVNPVGATLVIAQNIGFSKIMDRDKPNPCDDIHTKTPAGEKAEGLSQ
jgi:hypothetical protein